MKSADTATLRRLDAMPCTPSRMQLAALALADLATDLASFFPARPEILSFEGAGNNGEDARLACTLLTARGFVVRSFRLAPGADWLAFPPEAFPRRALVLDGLLGIGFRPPLRPEAARAIALLHALRTTRAATLLAVDLPSGLAADEPPAPDAPSVHADFTLTMGFPKRAFESPAALSRCGEVLVAPIAYPEEPEPDPARLDFFAPAPSAPRPWAAHKGDFGHVAVFAGSSAYPGAAVLATLGALRGGAGLVSAFVPASAAAALLVRAPEAIVRAYDAPTLSPAVLHTLTPDLRGRVLLVGPGLTRTADARRALDWLLSSPGFRAAVLDADALVPGLPVPEAFPVLLTPHPGEAARLLGVSPADVQRDRPAAARALAARTGAVVLLKGAGSLVAAPDGRLSLIPVGSPALARGGSGDILAGLCAACLAQGATPFEAACEAAFRHGHAAACAALRTGTNAFLPSDLLLALR